MSFEADTETVRDSIAVWVPSDHIRDALAALDRLVAEHERLRAGLREIEVRFSDAREHARALLDGTETPA